MRCSARFVASATAMLAAAVAAAPTTTNSNEEQPPNMSSNVALQLYRPQRDTGDARGYDHYYAPATPAPPPEPERGKADEALSSYYEFLVNEGSYKFWSVFEIVTAALLIYSAFAAIYYAKYTYATTEYDYDYFWKRSGDFPATVNSDDGGGGGGGDTFLGLSSTTFQRIMDAISSKKYS